MINPPPLPSCKIRHAPHTTSHSFIVGKSFAASRSYRLVQHPTCHFHYTRGTIIVTTLRVHRGRATAITFTPRRWGNRRTLTRLACAWILSGSRWWKLTDCFNHRLYVVAGLWRCGKDNRNLKSKQRRCGVGGTWK